MRRWDLRPYKPQPYEQKRRLPTLVLGVLMIVPSMIALEIDDSAWRRTATPLLVAAAFASVVCLYALLFWLVFNRFPRWITAQEDEAQRWQHAALLAGIGTGPLIIGFIARRLPIDPDGLSLGLSVLAAEGVFALMLWLMARHFPEVSHWFVFRWW
jgi:hypothetical protein